MAIQQSHKELVAELNRQRADVSKLKGTLNEIDREKESWFKKKKDISSRIRAEIQKIKESKAKRDLFTKEVKDLKSKRNELNKNMGDKLGQLAALRKEKSEIEKSLKIKDTPSRIKQQIDRLEFKIETDTSSFEKEKEIMKKIKELKKRYESAADFLESSKELREVSGGARKARKNANEIHNQIQEKAKQSQLLHEEIVGMSPEIDKLKNEEDDAFKKFSELKAKFGEANNDLKEKLKIMNSVKAQLDGIYSNRKEKKKREEELFLKSKEEAVNEKIRKRQKLTTEDLLVFQKFGKD